VLWKMAVSLLTLTVVSLLSGATASATGQVASGGSGTETINWVNALTALTPLLIAVGSGVWVVYTHIERKKQDPDEEAVVQGQPVPASSTIAAQPKDEWTWQDELHNTQDELREAGMREDAYREALIKAGIDPRQVLIEADLLPQRIVRHPQSRRRVIVETQPPLTPEQQVQLDKNGNTAQAGGEA
jgi:hypothetical protein